ncbi:hypothetical protein [Lyngbya confervoides]|uniref:Uncharacterized protein n=1 Tax=Lyngbya confervoides BDU141951 TaxID=1574623 RepID=A0ABD4T4X6_9CYAN|nr:hypothetical protein [Lyngbya confervoides]MCM1983569.1 hypothetical protein [Lyngbya confervoides BDU141951]
MSKLTVNLIQGSVSFDFSTEAAQALQSEISALMQAFRTPAGPKTTGDRPQAKPSLDYRFSGPLLFECFCNPNIWPTPFAAKVLITLREERLRLTTEAELTQLMEDLNQYLDQEA